MAISLKDHEDRIAELESKIASSGGIVESGTGWCKFANGLIMNFGRGSGDIKYAKPYTNNPYVAVAPIHNSPWNEECAITDPSTTGFRHRLAGYNSAVLCTWLAIGYLISYRILNYISKFLNSVKNLKAVM